MPHSVLANPRVTRELLTHFGLEAKYSLGQNFLIDDNVIGRILKLSGLSDFPQGEICDRTVLEIGCGIGTLSVALLKYACVIAVERDSDFAPILAKTCACAQERFALIQGDALKLEWSDIETASGRIGARAPHILVANLPYAVAATLILDYFERFSFLDQMTVMVQSEIADRIAASPGTKIYGAYSVKLRLYARVVDSFQVSPSCFFPKPHVDSTVIFLQRDPCVCADRQLIRNACAIADVSFSHRRKTIRNNLKSVWGAERAETALDTLGISPSARAETLTPKTFIKLAQILY